MHYWVSSWPDLHTYWFWSTKLEYISCRLYRVRYLLSKIEAWRGTKIETSWNNTSYFMFILIIQKKFNSVFNFFLNINVHEHRRQYTTGCLTPSKEIFTYIMVRTKLHFNEMMMMSTSYKTHTTQTGIKINFYRLVANWDTREKKVIAQLFMKKLHSPVEDRKLLGC